MVKIDKQTGEVIADIKKFKKGKTEECNITSVEEDLLILVDVAAFAAAGLLALMARVVRRFLGRGLGGGGANLKSRSLSVGG